MKAHIKKCIVDARVFLDVLEFTSDNVEWGGIGIGSYTARGDLLLKGILFPPQLNQNQAYCAFETKDVALLRFALEDLGLLPEVKIVAWVHSHPGHGIFLSGTDRQTYEDLLVENNRLIAVIIEPTKKEIGAFGGVRSDQRVAVEKHDLDLTEEERVKLAILPKMLPHMVKVFVPVMPMRPSAESVLKVSDALIAVITKLRNWLVSESNQHS